MLKIVKKVLILVFVSLVFFVLSTKVALAKECCSLPDFPVDETGCNVGTGGRELNKCDKATEKCNVSSNTCVPKDTPEFKDPECPPEMISPLQCGSICCTGAIGACDSKDNARPMFDCEATKQYAKKWSEKTFCSNDGSWLYDKGRNKCVRNTYEQWSLESKQEDCSTGVKGFDTAIGCIPTANLQEFLKFLLKWTFFASGGIILLMTIATGYTIITSAGNPEKLQAAKENIVALFSGLFLIAFSLILLQTIGADILKLPTF